jgi:hypothetical protein
VLAELQARGITETTPKVGDLVNRARAIASWSGEAPIATVEPVRKAIGSLSSQSPIRDLASGLHNALMRDYDVAAKVLPEAKGAIDFATKLKEAAETMTRSLEQYRPGKVGRMLTRELETPGGAPGSGAWLTTFFDPRKRLVPQVLTMKTGEAQLKTLQEAYLANVFERFSDDGIINGPRLSSFITENQPKLKYAFQNNPDTLRALQRLAEVTKGGGPGKNLPYMGGPMDAAIPLAELAGAASAVMGANPAAAAAGGTMLGSYALARALLNPKSALFKAVESGFNPRRMNFLVSAGRLGGTLSAEGLTP